jgi:molybdate transport system permease protein
MPLAVYLDLNNLNLERAVMLSLVLVVVSLVVLVGLRDRWLTVA